MIANLNFHLIYKRLSLIQDVIVEQEGVESNKWNGQTLKADS